MGRCVHKQKQKTRAPLYCKLSDMLSLNGEMGKSQDLPKRLSSPTPVSCNALCAVRKVYFSAQPNNLKLILNFRKYYPVEHIFVPACSSARKIHFFKF